MTAPARSSPSHYDSVEFIGEVRLLRDRGHSIREIAMKKNCGYGYMRAVFGLLERGCPQLIEKIERGQVPHTVAIHIGRAKNPDIQKILVEGYTAGTVTVRQIIAIRRRLHEYEREMSNRSHSPDAQSLMRHFSNETANQQRLIRKAKLVRSRLTFIVDAFQLLLSEGRFVAMLHSEGMHTMPKWLAERIKES